MFNKLLCLLMLFFVISGVAIVQADPNLVAWYKFDETSGANVADSSGNSFDTVISGTTNYGWDSEGVIDGCLNNHIANNNAYISVPTGVFSAMDRQGTFAFWAQLTELSASGLHTGGWFTGTDPNGVKLAWARAYQFDNYARFSAVYNLGTTSQDEWWSSYNDSTTADEWHHFAMVFDEVAGTKKLYFDGYLITNESSDIEEGDSIADINAFNIFHATSTGAGYWDSFHGKMDDFRIYDRSLSESEIERLSTPAIASDMMPADGQIAEANEDSDLTLYWKSGVDAADVNGHNVYFGTDYNSVANATLLSDEYQGTQTANSYDLYGLSDANTYYWRIDEVNGVDVWQGDTYSFTINHNITFFVTSDIHYGRFQVADNEQNNKNLIAQMNYIPGKIHYPALLGGELVQRPRALLVAGDLTDYGEEDEWEGYSTYDGFVDDFCGVLNYQLYEGYGNHDYELTGTDDYAKQQVKTRNLTREGISNLSTNDYHYSWDWNNVHFVNLNLYPGPQGGRWAEAEGSIDFLISDLADNVGISDNPVVIYHHFGMDDRALTWWEPEDANTYYEEIKNYNVIAIFHGHSHDANAYQWNGIDVYDVGTATNGEFAVVNITDDELIFGSVNRSGWQILDTKTFSVNPVTVLTYDNFESDFGNYTDGGGDCSRYTGGTRAYKDSCAINIQDNSGTSSSFYHTTGIDVNTPGYSEIKVTFSFYAYSMNTGHDFWVEYFDGNDWNTVATYVCGTDFSNGSFYTKTVTIDSGSYDFPTDMKIRFQCSAGNNYDDVYIDDITVTGE